MAADPEPWLVARDQRLEIRREGAVEGAALEVGVNGPGCRGVVAHHDDRRRRGEERRFNEGAFGIVPVGAGAGREHVFAGPDGAAEVVDPLVGDQHGHVRVVVEREIGPEGGSDHADSAEIGRSGVEKGDVVGGAVLGQRLRGLVEVVAVVLVVPGDVEHAWSVPPGVAEVAEEARRVWREVAGDDHGVDFGREGRDCRVELEVEVGEDLDAHRVDVNAYGCPRRSRVSWTIAMVEVYRWGEGRRAPAAVAAFSGWSAHA